MRPKDLPVLTALVTSEYFTVTLSSAPPTPIHLPKLSRHPLHKHSPESSFSPVMSALLPSPGSLAKWCFEFLPKVSPNHYNRHRSLALVSALDFWARGRWFNARQGVSLGEKTFSHPPWIPHLSGKVKDEGGELGSSTVSYFPFLALRPLGCGAFLNYYILLNCQNVPSENWARAVEQTSHKTTGRISGWALCLAPKFKVRLD